MSKKIKTAGIILIVAVFFILDRLLKELFLGLWHRAKFSLIGDWLTLKLSQNSGIAFSLPVDYRLVIIFTVIALIALVCLACLAYRQSDIEELSAYAFIIVGAISNLWDRVIGGSVVDYISIRYFSVLNFADIYITGGVVFLVAIYLFKTKKSKTVSA
jgi:signal peptidase II